jgi:hypothetical protein
MLDDHLRVEIANPAFLEQFQVRREEKGPAAAGPRAREEMVAQSRARSGGAAPAQALLNSFSAAAFAG